jgi:hypothetical protein
MSIEFERAQTNMEKMKEFRKGFQDAKVCRIPEQTLDEDEFGEAIFSLLASLHLPEITDEHRVAVIAWMHNNLSAELS